jgi:predicted RNA-binding Zn-ribbon protein involved in translation (DUF1610 family)
MNFKEFSITIKNSEPNDDFLSIIKKYIEQNSIGYLCPECGNSYFEFWNAVTYTHEHWFGKLDKYPLNNIDYIQISIKCIACGHKLHKGHESDHYECKDCYPEQSEILETIFSYRNLPTNWKFGAGDIIKFMLVRKAVQLAIIAFDNKISVKSRPEEDGTILLFFSKEDKILDVKINGNVSFTIIKQVGLEYECVDCSAINMENIDFDSIKCLLEYME